MIKKIIIVLIVFSSCSVNQRLIKNKDLSAIIYKAKCNNVKNKHRKYYFKARKQIEDKFDFINYDNDTIFVLQSLNVQIGTIYESIWTKGGMVEYNYTRGKTSLMNMQRFIKRLYPLIEMWDIETIKKEEKTYGGLLGGGIIFGMRIIINKKDIKYNCIRFDEFFNPDIDDPNYEPWPDKD